MQRKALTLAIAAALSLGTGSAFAYSFSDGGYTTANTAVIKISGSSAMTSQIKAWAQTTLCLPSGWHQTPLYIKDANNFAIVCKPAIDNRYPGINGPYPPRFTQPNIAIVMNSSGGSGNGISQLNTAGQGYMDVFQADPATGPLAKNYYGSNNFRSDVAVSDEELTILIKAGAVSGSAAGVISAPLNAVTFGTPVTLSLRNALQQAQFGSACVGVETEDCMPSLSQSQIASIFAGQAVGWSEFGLTNADDNIYIARHVVTSGTQTAARVFFLNGPCTDGMTTFLAGDNGEYATKPNACNAASYTGRVFEGSGGGNVEACLTNHQRNGRWAIGINSLELPSTTDTTPEYAIAGGALVTTSGNPNTGTPNKLFNKNFQRHIKISGFAPTTFNTTTGRYRFFFEAAVHTLATPLYGNTDGNALMVLMQADFNNPAVLAQLNATFNTTVLLGPGKSAGILAPTSSGVVPATPASESATVNAPQMYYTHAVQGAPSSCQPAMSFYATGINP